MAPILGIYASQISGHLWAPSGAYDSIATGVGTGSSGTITFSSIPQGYTHLQVRFFVQSASTASQVRVRINGDTGSNYTLHQLKGNGSTASAAAYFNETPITIPVVEPANGSTFGVAVMDILDYTNTNKFKTLRTLGGADLNGSGEVLFSSNLWRSTSAITTLDFLADGVNFATNSQIALYGVKGS